VIQPNYCYSRLKSFTANPKRLPFQVLSLAMPQVHILQRTAKYAFKLNYLRK
jgi:hypothetical protein